MTPSLGVAMQRWTVDEALKWADSWGAVEDTAPSGDQMALDSLAQEVTRLRAEVERLGGPDGVVSKVNARCDHLGMRLGEVIRERDAERQRCARIVREAASVHGLCCADREALADLVAGLGA